MHTGGISHCSTLHLRFESSLKCVEFVTSSHSTVKLAVFSALHALGVTTQTLHQWEGVTHGQRVCYASV